MQSADTIPYIHAAEAHQLLTAELQNFIGLMETLQPRDWSQPTMCTEWDVRDILAHQAGGYAAGARYLELLRQFRRLPRDGQLLEDAINALQVRDRAGRTPEELLAELRAAGPRAAHNWAYRFWLLKQVSIPHAVAGRLSLKHLMWVIHSRDTWMHRLDVCRATGREFVQSAEHDGRIVALVMRDVAAAWGRIPGAPPLAVALTGPAGGQWQLGAGKPDASLSLDVLEFNIFASGRAAYESARRQMKLSGDVAALENALEKLVVLY